METFKIISLGCKVNQYESSAYENQLQLLELVPSNDRNADLYIVNTCSVTQNADKESFQIVKRIVANDSKGQIVVTGCSSEIHRQAFENLSSNIVVVSNSDKEFLVNAIFPNETIPKFSINNFPGHTRAFIKIQNGCNNFCSYCIIPYTRGRSQSRNCQEILQEAIRLVNNGYKEIVITGIDVGNFQNIYDDKIVKLPALIEMISKIENIHRIRVSSINPNDVSADLLQTITTNRTLCNSMHISLQSGSNKILKLMNRKYSSQDICTIIDKILTIDPNFTFSTDIIVGFPGETEKDFEETIKMIEKIPLTKVHIFPYSQRPFAKSQKLPNKLPETVIQKRKLTINNVANEITTATKSKFLQTSQEILLENKFSEGQQYIHGYTSNFIPTKVLKNQCLNPNDIIEAKIIDINEEYLVGKLTNL